MQIVEQESLTPDGLERWGWLTISRSRHNLEIQKSDEPPRCYVFMEGFLSCRVFCQSANILHSHTKSEPEILHSTLHTKKFHLHRRAVCTIPSPTPGNLEQAKHGDFLETSDDLVTSYSICVQLPPGGACYLYGCTCTHLIFFGACTIFDKLMIVSSLRS